MNRSLFLSLLFTFSFCTGLLSQSVKSGIAGKKFFVAPVYEFMINSTANAKGNVNALFEEDTRNTAKGASFFTANSRWGVDAGYLVGRKTLLTLSYLNTKTVYEDDGIDESQGLEFFDLGLVALNYHQIKLGFERYYKWKLGGVGPYYGFSVGYNILTENKKLKYYHFEADNEGGIDWKKAPTDSKYKPDNPQSVSDFSFFFTLGRKDYISKSVYFDFSHRLNFFNVGNKTENNFTPSFDRFWLFELYNFKIAVGKVF